MYSQLLHLQLSLPVSLLKELAAQCISLDPAPDPCFSFPHTLLLLLHPYLKNIAMTFLFSPLNWHCLLHAPTFSASSSESCNFPTKKISLCGASRLCTATWESLHHALKFQKHGADTPGLHGATVDGAEFISLGLVWPRCSPDVLPPQQRGQELLYQAV